MIQKMKITQRAKGAQGKKKRGTIIKAKAKSHLKSPQISHNLSKKTEINFDTAKQQKTTCSIKAASKLHKKWRQNAVTTIKKHDNKPKTHTHVVLV